MDRSDSRVVRLAVIASAIVALVMAASATSYGQPGPSFGGPSCTAPPAPQADQWPRAGTVDLGATVSTTPVTFTGALLLGDSHRNGLGLVSVGPTSLNGGAVAGTDPFTYTARAGFVGADAFTYQIADGAGESTVGLVKVTVRLQ